jgi:hypothetical protein
MLSSEHRSPPEIRTGTHETGCGDSDGENVWCPDSSYTTTLGGPLPSMRPVTGAERTVRQAVGAVKRERATWALGRHPHAPCYARRDAGARGIPGDRPLRWPDHCHHRHQRRSARRELRRHAFATRAGVVVRGLRPAPGYPGRDDRTPRHRAALVADDVQKTGERPSFYYMSQQNHFTCPACGEASDIRRHRPRRNR